MAEIENKYPIVRNLIKQFPFFLEYYTDHCPFKKPGQLEYHRETIQKRLDLGSIKAALEDEDYIKSLYRTLQAWGIGSRGSKLKPFDIFMNSLSEMAHEICNLEEIKLDQKGLEIESVTHKIWRIIDSLQIVDNIAKLVPCSKTLHHILPDLVVPMDREYTQLFFGWQNPQFQYGQASCFFDAFKAFVLISREANPNQFVSSGWNTSLTKVIDNAVVGVILYLKSQLR